MKRRDAVAFPPQNGGDPFESLVLFLKNPADRLFRFLDERAGLVDVVRLVMTLPFWPFLAAMARRLRRRWFGRGARG